MMKPCRATATSRSVASTGTLRSAGIGALSIFRPATHSRRIVLEFDGAFRSALVFLNGCFMGRNDNGYVPFQFDVSDFLDFGGQNFLVVRVDATFGEGWFYEGAGIYRHVWLTKTGQAASGQL